MGFFGPVSARKCRLKLPAETAAGESDAPGAVYGNTDEGESERGFVASVHPLLEAFAGTVIPKSGISVAYGT